QRRAAHRDLAAAVDGVRRPWHLAAAASGPDEAAAQALVEIAAEVRLAGGIAAEAQALERAAELSPNREVKARRMLAASQAWRRAGRLKHGVTIAQRALPIATSVRTRAELQLERGSFLVRSDEPEAARALLMAEAERAALSEPKLAAQMMVKAAFPSATGLETMSTVAVSYRALELAGHDGDRAELEALNAVMEHRTETGLPPEEEDLALVRRAAELLERSDLRTGSDELHWIAYCLALFELDDQARRLSDLGLTEARASGDVWNLCYGLYARAAIEQVTGRLDAARPLALEGLALAEELDETFRFNEACAIMAEVEAGRGAREEALRVHEARRAFATRDPLATFYRSNLRGWLGIAAGDFAEAVTNLEIALRLSRSGPARAWYLLVPLELAEAYLGAGRRKEAEKLLGQVGPEIERSPLMRPRAKLARVRAFAAPEGRYDAGFAQTLALLEATPQPHDRARTELAWGERLGRSQRQAEAAVHFERALAQFEALGAAGWAERVRHEFEVLTGKARQVQPRRTEVLSAQELRIAQHAAAGMRDREIAAVLYLSPRTVESHLQSAYRKLEVVNRTQLAAVLAGDGIGTQSPVIPR
ncbi:MAG TPA: helix-turn-helix transcriptional regulator, partial [Patescibacteria group bacterium]|nr:helix-turn-helix transcriptional regulator [Patescibacteria group bacterium]